MSNWRPKNWTSKYHNERDRLMQRIDKGDNKEHPFIDQLFYENYYAALAFEDGADAMLKAISEEIEKGLLTFEEVKMCLRAVTETPPEGIKRDEPEFLVAVLRVIAQAQLQKILALFGK